MPVGFLRGHHRAVSWLCLSALGATGAVAQEILRSSQGQQDPFRAAAPPTPQAPPGNIQWGDLSLRLSASLGAGYDDNLNYSENEPIDGFSLTPGVQMSGFYPLSDFNSLTFSLGASYQAYFNRDEYSRFNLTPGSSLSLNFFVEEFRFNIYDNISYSVDPFDVGSVSGTGKYGGLNNAAGLSVSRDFNLFATSLGYEHSDFLSTTDASDNEERSSDSIFYRMPFRASDALSVGPEAGITSTRYRSDVHNDSWSYSGGVFAAWQATDLISISPRVGVVHYDFQQTSRVVPAHDSTQMYFSIAASHTINRNVQHSLSFGREQRPGVNSDLLDLYTASYSLNLNVIEDTRITPSFNYEHGDDSESGVAETYDRFWVGLTVSRQIIEHLAGSLSYRFTLRDSDRAGSDYEQNVVTLALNYAF